MHCTLVTLSRLRRAARSRAVPRCGRFFLKDACHEYRRKNRHGNRHQPAASPQAKVCYAFSNRHAMLFTENIRPPAIRVKFV
jgi:hypothetical protein